MVEQGIGRRLRDLADRLSPADAEIVLEAALALVRRVDEERSPLNELAGLAHGAVQEQRRSYEAARVRYQRAIQSHDTIEALNSARDGFDLETAKYMHALEEFASVAARVLYTATVKRGV